MKKIKILKNTIRSDFFQRGLIYSISFLLLLFFFLNILTEDLIVSTILVLNSFIIILPSLIIIKFNNLYNENLYEANYKKLDILLYRAELTNFYRKCFKCKNLMDFTYYIYRNINIEKDFDENKFNELLKIWNSKDIEIYCCNCFLKKKKENKKRFD